MALLSCTGLNRSPCREDNRWLYCPCTRLDRPLFREGPKYYGLYLLNMDLKASKKPKQTWNPSTFDRDIKKVCLTAEFWHLQLISKELTIIISTA